MHELPECADGTVGIFRCISPCGELAKGGDGGGGQLRAAVLDPPLEVLAIRHVPSVQEGTGVQVDGNAQLTSPERP